jgi:hypothetical protein
MISLVPYIIPRNLCKKSPDAARTSFTMTGAWCLYISCVYDSTLSWELFDALTTSHNMPSVRARSFTEIDHDATRNVIGVQYTTPQPWHVLISWSPDQLISHPSQLVILALHIHIIIFMQVLCQFLEPNCPKSSYLSITTMRIFVPSFHQ